MPDKLNQFMDLPFIPLREMMVFPQMTLTFDVARTRSLAALDLAVSGDRKIFLTAQKDLDKETPEIEDLYRTGTICEVKQVMSLPGDLMRVLVMGEARAELKEIGERGQNPVAHVQVLTPAIVKTTEITAAMDACTHTLSELVEVAQRMNAETMESIVTIEDPDRFADTMAANVLFRLADRQEILETVPVHARLEKLLEKLVAALEVARVEKDMTARIHQAMEKSQREYYLREQIKAAQTELGDTDATDADELRERLKNTPLNDEAREKCEKEIERLSRMTPGTPEITTSLTYIEWILDMPWGKTTEDNLDLERARKVLEEDHYGLDKVKERIVEYLAVLQVKKDMKGPILCFV
ncbi:MAG: LON peptidase substrate-binding domain-containing protein, partial [Clostridia bacterium]|nr:LON peptidase substrate-binding domain-containing protein [Clostridia bacterium]